MTAALDRKRLLSGGLAILLLGGCATPPPAQPRPVVPPPPAEVRPPEPGPRHVWVPGGWAWDGAKWVWHDGHWISGQAPPPEQPTP